MNWEKKKLKPTKSLVIQLVFDCVFPPTNSINYIKRAYALNYSDFGLFNQTFYLLFFFLIPSEESEHAF